MAQNQFQWSSYVGTYKSDGSGGSFTNRSSPDYGTPYTTESEQRLIADYKRMVGLANVDNTSDATKFSAFLGYNNSFTGNNSNTTNNNSSNNNIRNSTIHNNSQPNTTLNQKEVENYQIPLLPNEWEEIILK